MQSLTCGLRGAGGKVHNAPNPGEPVEYDKLERVFVSWTESQETGEEQH